MAYVKEPELTQSRASSKFNVRYFFSKFGVLIAFVILVLILSLLSSNFGTVDNMFTILRQASISGILAVGMTFVIISGGIDLSVGAVVAAVAVFTTTYAQNTDNFDVSFAVLMGLGLGALFGLVNGLLISKAKLAPFIVTLATMSIARGFAYVFCDGSPIIDLKDSYNQIGGGYFFTVPYPVIIFIIAILIGIYILNFSKFGRHVYAVGGNETSATMSGVKVKKVLTLVYVLSGLLAAVAGIVLSSRVQTGSPTAGIGYELDAIAAVVIGGTSLSGGVGHIWGTVVGVLIIGVISNGLDILHIPSEWQSIVKAIIIIIAVVLEKTGGEKKD